MRYFYIIISALIACLSVVYARSSAIDDSYAPPADSDRFTIPDDIEAGDLDCETRETGRNLLLPLGRPDEEDDDTDLDNSPPAIRKQLDSTQGDSASEDEIENLTYYTYLVANAYCRNVVLNSDWTCPHCKGYVDDVSLIYTFQSAEFDMRGYILRDDKNQNINVVYRGSNSVKNFVSDFQTDKIDYPPVKGTQVHRGFYDSYLDVADLVVPVVQQEIELHPDYTFVITGHSLGAAVAILSALDLYQKDMRFGPDNMKIYTFGGPRVGDPEFAYYTIGTNIPLIRTVHRLDVVPHVPPQNMGFLHAGPEYWIQKDGGRVKVCNTQTEIGDCSNSIVPYTTGNDHIKYFNVATGTCQ
ncbi:Alpha/Beta hydrolase protein [Phycomyces nitens]|nr:Alpha/Beta hydrolase protein [Phycomyces nitens]